ncbi:MULTISPECIES: divalent-cation tolerance protein CutA [unclassified Solwaraspora]|uniref:divalent-cation tolerance protein CutA n=1 Tax=unclassified Solwaraspora TaxID=2627926 RepID=UPI00259B78DB|nr:MULTISPECIES: divalent-cation tolerance protein CutA [unclassified Solwaraspora]WJK34488.1 divalent-cation tolerance protein CutA [Solwaraspora sp. WMMA2065]WJK40481.1 divalent-cation tolerance protein CutA [Solwaraspora sp. WMMA2056]
MSSQQHCHVVTATDSRTVAEALADSAVAARLAASAQIAGPIRSTYRWQGEVVAAEEWRVTFRTTITRYADLEEHIRARHNYEVPGIVCVPIVAGFAPYLQWIVAETQER